jgi:excinuclease ABC subunit A
LENSLIKKKNIAEVLDMTVEEAYRFFASEKTIADKLRYITRSWFGYVKLGQPATTLSRRKRNE